MTAFDSGSRSLAAVYVGNVDSKATIDAVNGFYGFMGFNVPKRLRLWGTPQWWDADNFDTCTDIAQYTGAWRFASIETLPPRTGSNPGTLAHWVLERRNHWATAAGGNINSEAKSDPGNTAAVNVVGNSSEAISNAGNLAAVNVVRNINSEAFFTHEILLPPVVGDLEATLSQHRKQSSGHRNKV